MVNSSAETARYLSGVYVTSLEQAYENIAFYRKNNGNGDFYIAIRKWNAEEKGTLLGLIIATRPIEKIKAKSLEVAYLMGRDFRGNGYMQEAIRGFIPIAQTLGYQQLLFEIVEDNKCSIKVIENLGAQLIKKILKPDEQLINLYVLNLDQM